MDESFNWMEVRYRSAQQANETRLQLVEGWGECGEDSIDRDALNVFIAKNGLALLHCDRKIVLVLV